MKHILTLVSALLLAPLPALNAADQPAAESDFAERFANPPLAYRPNINRHHVTPNDTENGQLLDKIVGEGYGGFACNVNWTSDYLKNDEQLKSFFRFCETARSRGLNLWLYDEKGYPSGMAGGMVLAEHPEWEAEGLLFKGEVVTGAAPVQMTAPPGHLLLAAAVPVREGRAVLGEAVRLEPQVAGGVLTWQAPVGTWQVAMVSTDALYQGYQAGTERGGSAPRYPSLLEPGVTKRFIELTHAKYAQALGRPLGSLFHATFTDEPSLMAQPYRQLPHGVYPWKKCLSEEISRRYGWRPEERLLAMMLDDGSEGQRLRYQYFAAVTTQVSQGFFRSIKDACTAQGFRSGGHLLLEESLLAHVPLYGSIFACFREMQVPGIDVLTAMPAKTRRYLYSARLAASAAELNGSCQVMSEPCPVADLAEHGGREGPTLQAKGALNRQLIGGVTVFNNYLKLENATTAEKFQLNTYLARIGLAMSDNRRAAEIAVLYPIESVWTRFKPVPNWLASWDAVAGGAPEARQVEATVDSASDLLYDSRREFSYLDARALVEATVKDGTLRLGAASWRVLLLPRADTLPLEAWQVVRKFWDSGGTVVAVGVLPRNSESEFPSPAVERLFAEVFTGQENAAGGVGMLVAEPDAAGLGACLDRRLKRPFTIEPAQAKVLTSHKVEAGCHTIFIANDSEAAQAVTFVWTGGGELSVWDPQTGTGGVSSNSVILSLAPFESRIIRIKDSR